MGPTRLFSGMKLISWCVLSGFSWEGLPRRPILDLTVTGVGLAGRNYKAMCGWLLPVLDLEAIGLFSL